MGAGAMRARVSKLLLSSNLFGSSHLSQVSNFESASGAVLLHQALPCSRERHYSSGPNRPMRRRRGENQSEEDFLRSLNFGSSNGDDEVTAATTHQGSSSYSSNRPLRGDKRLDDLFPGDHANENLQRSGRGRISPPFGRPMRGEGREGVPSQERANPGSEYPGGSFDGSRRNSPVDPAGKPLGGSERGDRSGNLDVGSLGLDGPLESPPGGEKRGDLPVSSLLQKLKLGRKADEEKAHEHPPNQTSEADAPLPKSSVQDADEIFRKMKETGLIPNAVAMLDGLCKDGLIQEAMKLFGLMREKGTIPEVVIYTAVVEGFCKAAKFDDAKRVFKKMQHNGISPNAFSYKVLIEGLFKGKRLEDSVDFCLEMLDAGHSPSVVTFTGLVAEFCKEKGVEEAEGVVRRLRERGLAVDDKAVREHLDKKGPFLPAVWDAIFGKKMTQKPF